MLPLPSPRFADTATVDDGPGTWLENLMFGNRISNEFPAEELLCLIYEAIVLYNIAHSRAEWKPTQKLTLVS
jgi:hypothetical protein